MGAGEAAGLRRVAETLDRVFSELPGHPVRIALETTAGQGTCLGHTFEHLRDLLGAVREPDRLCVCLDTAHVFAAGYDLSSEEGTLATLAEFDRVVGFRHLVALHLNDSKAARGSRVDRHEAIGRGKIGLPAFRAVLNHPRLRRLPMLLETPKGPDLKEDRVNLATLRGLLA
jgi:deoxyribonuclease-4